MIRKNRGRGRLSVILTALLLAGSIGGCSVAGYDMVFDMGGSNGNIIFSINEKNCSEAESKLYLANYKNLYGSAYGVDLWKYDFKDSLEEYVRDVTLDELSRVYCMEQIAEEQGIWLDSEERKRADQAAERYENSLSDEDRDYLDLNLEQMKEFYRRYALSAKLYGTLTGGETEEVSDDEARVIRIRQICTKEAAKAKEAGKKLKAGKSFASVAGDYNQAKESELTVARGQLDAALEKVAFDLDDDQISEIVQAGKDYYIFQCISKYEEKLTEKNKEVILNERREQKFTDAYGDFVKKAGRKLNETVWEQVEFPGEKVKTDLFFTEYEAGQIKS